MFTNNENLLQFQCEYCAPMMPYRADHCDFSLPKTIRSRKLSLELSCLHVFAGGSESCMERKFQGAKVLRNGNNTGRKFQGAKVLGRESSTGRKFHSWNFHSLARMVLGARSPVPDHSKRSLEWPFKTDRGALISKSSLMNCFRNNDHQRDALSLITPDFRLPSHDPWRFGLVVTRWLRST